MNKRKVLGSVLYKVRFPLMDEDYFARHLLKNDLLASEEKREVMKFYTRDVECSTCIFNSKKRNFFVKEFEVKVIRFKSVLRGSWEYNSSASHAPDKIIFSISKPAVLHGVVLYGDERNSKYKVDLSILDDKDTVLSLVKTNYKASTLDSMSNIILDEPISVDANRHYKVKAFISGPISKAGDDGMKHVFIKGIKISFYKQNEDNNGTNIEIGQIPGLLLSF